ncbi:5086_t:CDS:2 [Entrophospora sp. SA101]|nr:5086_t:CDS:2 [Entrophospora sp. SA101]
MKNTLTLKDKREICVLKQSKPTPTNRDLAIRFKICENTVCDILKRKSEYLAINPEDPNSHNKRLRKGKYSGQISQITDSHIVETVQDNFEEESSQLEHLIDKLPFDDPIMAIDYITIDNEVVEEETVMEDEEIIATVTLTSNNGNQEEEIETPVVTLTEALRGAEALLNFVTYPPEKFEISTKQISSIRSVRSSILLYKSSLAHQHLI